MVGEPVFRKYSQGLFYVGNINHLQRHDTIFGDCCVMQLIYSIKATVTNQLQLLAKPLNLPPLSHRTLVSHQGYSKPFKIGQDHFPIKWNASPIPKRLSSHNDAMSLMFSFGKGV
jgi:hypothetical protein